ncbi:MAG: DUF5615 family PIN-like protein [Deltaproteobacteria bacterium]|nr:DUF5615 family PIN-like protein [Deltaproteobacteria bacterium]
MKLLLDEDLSPRISEALRRAGVDAVSVHELGRQGLSDREQLAYASAEDRCLVTRNRNDFLLLTREFFDRGEPHRESSSLLDPAARPVRPDRNGHRKLSGTLRRKTFRLPLRLRDGTRSLNCTIVRRSALLAWAGSSDTCSSMP